MEEPRYARVRTALADALHDLDEQQRIGASREVALAITNIEQGAMWLVAHQNPSGLELAAGVEP